MLHKCIIEDLLKNTKTPVLSHCRKLIKEGYGFSDTLEAYRANGVLSLKISSIGEAAELTVKETNEIGPIFVKYRAFKT